MGLSRPRPWPVRARRRRRRRDLRRPTSASSAAAGSGSPAAPCIARAAPRALAPQTALGHVGVLDAPPALPRIAHLERSRRPTAALPPPPPPPRCPRRIPQPRRPSPQRRPRSAWIPAPADGLEDVEGHFFDVVYQSDSAAVARAARVSEASVADWGLPNVRLPGTAGYGVRSWLDGISPVRYAPVFEYHEVDDEVLPLLTLEDLKVLGIGAAGSRWNLFPAIQKLQGDGNGRDDGDGTSDDSLGDDDIQRSFLSFSSPSFISKFISVSTKVLRHMKFDRLTVISKVSTELTATYLNEKEANATSDGQLLSHLIGEVSENALDEDGLCSLYELKASCRKSKSVSNNLPRKRAKFSKSPIVSQ